MRQLSLHNWFGLVTPVQTPSSKQLTPRSFLLVKGQTESSQSCFAVRCEIEKGLRAVLDSAHSPLTPVQIPTSTQLTHRQYAL